MTIVSTATPFRVVVVGCSYAGLATALNLSDLSRGLSPRQGDGTYRHHPVHTRVPVNIIIVDKRDGFYHLIGCPLALASESYTPKAWVRACDLPALRNNPHIRFLQGTATSLDASSRRLTVSPASGGANGKPGVVLEYDFLVAASGLDRPWPVVPQTVARKDYLAEAGAHIARVGRPDAVVLVVGGGAVGVEMAAELKLVHPHVRVVLAQSRDKLLASEGLPDECKDKALELLRETGVEVLMGHRVVGPVTDVDGGAWKEVEFSTGEKMLASHVVWAVSRPRPTSSYLPAGSLDAEGYVNILPSLRFAPGSPNAVSHYCAGDLARWSGIKRCGGAMHQGYYAAVNIHQAMLARLDPAHTPALLKLAEVPPMIGLAVGKKALACGPDGMTFGEDTMRDYFGDDLGFTIVWNYLRLGKAWNDE